MPQHRQARAADPARADPPDHRTHRRRRRRDRPARRGRRAAARCRSCSTAGIEALTISFLWSTVNPVHEQRAREIAREVAPELFVSCGSDLSSKAGEYERTMTAVMNSYIGPLMVEYVDRIQQGARERGFAGTVQFAQCAGGAITSEEARRAPIRTVQSGPVAGTIATQTMAGAAGLADVMAVDMGGTTFDVSVIHDGRALQRDVSIFERYAMALPMLDIESVGAGGGSIAWVDDQGRLNVGPHSAGRATRAGVLRPRRHRADRHRRRRGARADRPRQVPRRADAARRRRSHARRSAGSRSALGLGLMETAAGISTVVDAKMADLVRRMSLLRGLDPRRFACAAFGGGGPLHCAGRRRAGRHPADDRPAAARGVGVVGVRRGDVRRGARLPALDASCTLPVAGRRRGGHLRASSRRRRPQQARHPGAWRSTTSHSSGRCGCATPCRSTTSRCPSPPVPSTTARRRARRRLRTHPRRAVRQGVRVPRRRRRLHGVPGPSDRAHHQAAAAREAATAGSRVEPQHLLARAAQRRRHARRTSPCRPARPKARRSSSCPTP